MAADGDLCITLSTGITTIFFLRSCNADRKWEGDFAWEQKTGHLDAKTRELIALAVAITRQCDGCITVHTDAAAKHGATREEVAEALGVAIAVNAGAALVFSARVMDAFSVKQS